MSSDTQRKIYELSGDLREATTALSVNLANWAGECINQNREIADRLGSIYDRRLERFQNTRHFHRRQSDYTGNQFFEMQIEDMAAIWEQDRQDHEAFLRLLAEADPSVSVEALLTDYDTLVAPVKAETEQLSTQMTELLKQVADEDAKAE